MILQIRTRPILVLILRCSSIKTAAATSSSMSHSFVMITVQPESKPLFPAATSNGFQNMFYSCRYCSQEFKREDHLSRHELSHQDPRYHCPHPACDKAFRRKDVLKRHQLVHIPGPSRRRRWAKNETAKVTPSCKARGQIREASSAISTGRALSDEISTTIRLQPGISSIPPSLVRGPLNKGCN